MCARPSLNQPISGDAFLLDDHGRNIIYVPRGCVSRRKGSKARRPDANKAKPSDFSARQHSRAPPGLSACGSQVFLFSPFQMNDEFCYLDSCQGFAWEKAENNTLCGVPKVSHFGTTRVPKKGGFAIRNGTPSELGDGSLPRTVAKQYRHQRALCSGSLAPLQESQQRLSTIASSDESTKRGNLWHFAA